MSKQTPFASLAKNIAARRKALSLTQAQLAEAIEVDTETLGRFERGKHLPSLQTLARLGAHLQISASELLDDAPVPTPSDLSQVSAWLLPLNSVDREFVLKLIEVQCGLLRSRAKGVSRKKQMGRRH